MRVLVFVPLLMLIGCKAPVTMSPGHNCSEIYIDSIFIQGEHICFAEEHLCSYENDEWVMIVEQ